MLEAYDDGVRAVLPRPSRDAESFGDAVIRFLPTFRACVDRCASDRAAPHTGQLRDTVIALRQAREVPEAALAVLQFVAVLFERALILVVRDGELVAERGIGIQPGPGLTVTPPLGFRVPLTESSLFGRVIDTGRIHFGKTEDATVTGHLFAQIGPPHRSTLLLLPLKLRGKTIALVYADFGSREIAPVELDLLDILGNQAGLALENAAYRKKLEKTPAEG